MPAVVLLDVMMPGMDGLEICRRLRDTPGLRNTAIIMVSAKAMPSERAAGIRAGADDYITKPFDEVELLEVLRRYLKPAAQQEPTFWSRTRRTTRQSCSLEPDGFDETAIHVQLK